MKKIVAIKVPRSMRAKRKLLKHGPKLKKNVTNDVIEGKLGRIYIPDQEIGIMGLTSAVKGLKRERRDTKKNKDSQKKKKPKKNKEHSKKQTLSE